MMDFSSGFSVKTSARGKCGLSGPVRSWKCQAQGVHLPVSPAQSSTTRTEWQARVEEEWGCGLSQRMKSIWKWKLTLPHFFSMWEKPCFYQVLDCVVFSLETPIPIFSWEKCSYFYSQWQTAGAISSKLTKRFIDRICIILNFTVFNLMIKTKNYSDKSVYI